METDHDYFERKHAELALIAQSLGGVDCPRPQSLQEVIETKWRRIAREACATGLGEHADKLE
jgi:hypothetical protein